MDLDLLENFRRVKVNSVLLDFKYPQKRALSLEFGLRQNAS